MISAPLAHNLQSHWYTSLCADHKCCHQNDNL